jgi:hypothetical protein
MTPGMQHQRRKMLPRSAQRLTPTGFLGGPPTLLDPRSGRVWGKRVSRLHDLSGILLLFSFAPPAPPTLPNSLKTLFADRRSTQEYACRPSSSRPNHLRGLAIRANATSPESLLHKFHRAHCASWLAHPITPPSLRLTPASSSQRPPPFRHPLQATFHPFAGRRHKSVP